MTYVLYNTAMAVVAPLAAGWLATHPKHKPLLVRFRPPLPPSCSRRPIWVHACSVGEVGTAKPLIQAMQQRWRDWPLLLTVSTASGHERARTTCSDVPLTWFPFDCRRSVRRFLHQLRPLALVLIETEIWPNVLRETRRLGAPVVLINGRLSDKHFGRYRRFRRFFRPVVRYLSTAGMQNDEYAARLIELGADPAKVRVTGSTKFDGVVTEVAPDLLARTRRENGFDAGDPVVVFGSARPGDEALAATCWSTLRDRFPALRLVIAPRHRDHLEAVMAVFDEPLLRRSEVRQGRRPKGERLFMLDTVGELVTFYALASVAVIGGSFYPGVNGHNPLESAALGVPTVFGPYMRNFIDPARELLVRGGAVQVTRPEDLAAVLGRLLQDPFERAKLGGCGREAVLANQGSIARNLDLLETVVPLRG
jgi:3-deoxy-D-manno-octulosonic-acid transferase